MPRVVVIPSICFHDAQQLILEVALHQFGANFQNNKAPPPQIAAAVTWIRTSYQKFFSLAIITFKQSTNSCGFNLLSSDVNRKCGY
jgi:hypothetical protein